MRKKKKKKNPSFATNQSAMSVTTRPVDSAAGEAACSDGPPVFTGTVAFFGGIRTTPAVFAGCRSIVRQEHMDDLVRSLIGYGFGDVTAFVRGEPAAPFVVEVRGSPPTADSNMAEDIFMYHLDRSLREAVLFAKSKGVATAIAFSKKSSNFTV